MPTNNAINSNIPIEISKGGTGTSTGAFTTINFVTITSTSTYTPPTNLLYAIVECVGGGGGGSGTPATTAGQIAVGGGGGGGGYTKKIYARSALLPNVSVTIGAAGAAGAAGANDGTNGGDTTFLGMTASGGGKGTASAAAAVVNYFGTDGGAASGGDVNVVGSAVGYYGYSTTVGGNFSVSIGGHSPYSGAARPNASGNGYGGGGGGIYANSSAAAAAGKAGTAGVVFITEFLA